jgi:single-strand DNA-binding protein
MADVNRVFLAGRLTRDPEVRYTPSGMAVADLGLAISERFKTKEGDWEEKTVFVDVVVWGRQAETSGEFLYKGSPVLVEGRLQLDQWENQQGEKRTKLRVRADRVQFLGSPRKDDVADTPPSFGGGSVAQGNGPAVTDDEDIPF